ncbi:MAG: CpsB/CapC family capsule biosynthesis tyrosine phosphatase [Desulfomonilaceae bacterium]
MLNDRRPHRLLPDVDNGAKGIKESLNMYSAAADGIRVIVATPIHLIENFSMMQT